MTEMEKIEQIPDETAREFVKTMIKFKPQDLPEEPEKNVWYTYRPKGCVCSDGEPYYSTMKVGTENKLLIMFCGGGVALDPFSAARPSTLIPQEGKPTFYNPNTDILGYFHGRSGLADSKREDNPFKDWSMVVVCYASGDFHCGTNDFSYDDEELGSGVCHHNGYLIYQAMAEKMKEFVPNPEEIMVTGFSAGGFGTALLTSDVLERFPECKKAWCLVDSAFFTYDGWHKTAVNQWGAPGKISEKLVSNNLTLDCLLDLHRRYGERVKIAVDCTYRDALLSQMQNYTDGRSFTFDLQGGDRFQRVLRDTVEKLQKEIPDIAVYIFDKESPEVQVGDLTDHTIIAVDAAYDYAYQGVKFIDWIRDWISGKPEKIGLELLEKKCVSVEG